jgi:hypothetical protein
MDVTTLAPLLREAQERHDVFELSAPPHDWSEWYAAYVCSREVGRTRDEAIRDAGIYLEAMLQRAATPW